MNPKLRTQNLRFILFCLVAGCGCSSVTDSGFTKRELRNIKAVVAAQTTNEITGLGIPLQGRDPIDVQTTTEDGSSFESFTLRRTPEGWKITKRITLYPVPTTPRPASKALSPTADQKSSPHPITYRVNGTTYFIHNEDFIKYNGTNDIPGFTRVLQEEFEASTRRVSATAPQLSDPFWQLPSPYDLIETRSQPPFDLEELRK